MKKTICPFVENEIFIAEVKRVFDKIETAYNEIDNTFYSNVIDPFSAYFDMLIQDISQDRWIEQEKSRQIQKTLQNEIGYFHQNILGSIGEWKNPGSGGGFDVENKSKKIFAEIKNKWNTFNSSSMDATYEKMVRYLNNEKKGYKAYIVMILPKKSERFIKKFVPPQKQEREDLLLVDGATFYEIVTGNKNGIKIVFESIEKAVKIIEERTGKKYTKNAKFSLDLFIKAYGN